VCLRNLLRKTTVDTAGKSPKLDSAIAGAASEGRVSEERVPSGRACRRVRAPPSASLCTNRCETSAVQTEVVSLQIEGHDGSLGMFWRLRRVERLNFAEGKRWCVTATNRSRNTVGIRAARNSRNGLTECRGFLILIVMGRARVRMRRNRFGTASEPGRNR
jgi:hypothetical protein